MGMLFGLPIVLAAASFLVDRAPRGAPRWFSGDADASNASSA
jgi:hypothetical protein